MIPVGEPLQGINGARGDIPDVYRLHIDSILLPYLKVNVIRLNDLTLVARPEKLAVRIARQVRCLAAEDMNAGSGIPFSVERWARVPGKARSASGRASSCRGISPTATPRRSPAWSPR